MRKSLFILAAIATIVCSCEKHGADSETPDAGSKIENEFINRCNFESVRVTFHANQMTYEIVSNPAKDSANGTRNCAKVVSVAGDNEFLWCDPLPRKLDFTRNAPIFKMMVYAPKKGAEVSFKLEHPDNYANNPKTTTAVTTKAGEWEELVFDFTDQELDDNFYQKIVLTFDRGKAAAGDTWYFDEILCPSDDLTDICLFKRYENNPVFKPEGPASWRNQHIANAGILSPANSPDGNWWMYLRGSGDKPYYCDQIGLYKQSAANFKPFGPWNEYEHNPVLPVGASGSFDDGFLLDTAPVVGKDGVVYVYYNGNNRDRSKHGLCVRYSTDGGYTFTGIDAPVLVGKGCSDAVYHNGKYYIYYGGGNPCRLYVTVTGNPLSFAGAQTYETIPIGGGPSNFDSYAVNGSMIFRLEGVDKWFASYQGSSNSYDFPDRFHIAMSDDLIHWTKVDNDQPLYTRGSPGDWDQGGIWFCEIIEHQGMLYLYYEGWGREGYVENRDQPYFSGRSCIGAASASKEDFLKWCGLKK